MKSSDITGLKLISPRRKWVCLLHFFWQSIKKLQRTNVRKVSKIVKVKAICEFSVWKKELEWQAKQHCLPQRHSWLLTSELGCFGNRTVEIIEYWNSWISSVSLSVFQDGRGFCLQIHLIQSLIATLGSWGLWGWHISTKRSISDQQSQHKDKPRTNIHFSFLLSATALWLSFSAIFNNNKKEKWYTDHQLSVTSRPCLKSHISMWCCSQLVSAGSLLTG